jgi:hypothetical protein
VEHLHSRLVQQSFSVGRATEKAYTFVGLDSDPRLTNLLLPFTTESVTYVSFTNAGVARNPEKHELAFPNIDEQDKRGSSGKSVHLNKGEAIRHLL